MADYNFLLETRLSQDQQLALQTLQRVCREASLNLYLTGGPMRDLVSGRPVRFLEFTTEGSPVPLAPALKLAKADHLSPHPDRSSLNLSLRGCRLRIREARGNGKAAGTILEDLRHRGLTLNSIGLSLNPGSRGLPLDPTNGTADIEARLVRMNHSYVFLEDPIVLLRAVRMRARLEFAIEDRTASRMESAREGNYLEKATPAARGQELEALAYEPDPAAVLRAWEQDQWLEAAFGKGIRTAKMNMAGLARLGGVVESWEQLGLTVDSGLAALPFILGGLAPADQNRLAQILLSRHLASEWKKVPSDARAFEKKLLNLPPGGMAASARKIQDLIEQSSPEALVFASIDAHDAKAGKRLKEFQTFALQLRQRLPLGILRGLGLAPHSLEAEGILRPFYRRLLAGEALTDTELSEGLRAATLVLRPAPVVVAPPPSAKGGRGGRKLAPPPAKPAAPIAPQPSPEPVGKAPEAKPDLAPKTSNGGKSANAAKAGKPASAPESKTKTSPPPPPKPRSKSARPKPNGSNPSRAKTTGKATKRARRPR